MREYRGGRPVQPDTGHSAPLDLLNLIGAIPATRSAVTVGCRPAGATTGSCNAACMPRQHRVSQAAVQDRDRWRVFDACERVSAQGVGRVPGRLDHLASPGAGREPKTHDRTAVFPARGCVRLPSPHHS